MRNRGFSLIELLVAVLLLALAISGLVVLWGFAFNTTAHSQDIAVAYSIARQEIESARGRGYMLLSMSERTVGYDGEGRPTEAANPAYQVEIIPRVDNEADPRCLRMLTVQVTARGRPVFQTSTYFTRWGI